jgi:selenocysteine lyase/cysteine desulfurase
MALHGQPLAAKEAGEKKEVSKSAEVRKGNDHAPHKEREMISQMRKDFPAIHRSFDDQTAVYLDGPAGTQIPSQVIDAISDYYRKSNANTHGMFQTSIETDEVMDLTRRNAVAFLGAEGPNTISFGQNMTSLAFSLSRAFGKVFQPGDEILITQLDHEANRGPWLALRDRGIIVKEIKVLENGTLDYSDFENKISDRTRLVAMGLASNLSGAVNNVKLARKLTYDNGVLCLQVLWATCRYSLCQGWFAGSVAHREASYSWTKGSLQNRNGYTQSRGHCRSECRH